MSGIRKPGLKGHSVVLVFSKIQLSLFLLTGLILTHFNSKACSPLNVPTIVGTPTITATQLMIKWQSTTPYFCPDVIVVEIACNSAAYSGLAQYSFTSAIVTGASNPYTYPTMTINIASLCPGTVYKYRAKEKNNSSTTSSSWSGNFTFTTLGTFTQPTLLLNASPNTICPPQTSQLTASLVNGCGGSGITYSWAPGASLSCITCSNPIASPAVPTTYTCWATGGQWGCWTASNTINVGVTTVPPNPGVASASPATLCAGYNTTLTSTSYTGNLQWQSSASPGGPFTNIAGATTGTFVTAALAAGNYYFQGSVAGCGSTLTTNQVLVTVNPSIAVTVNSASMCSGTSINLTANGGFTYTWSAGANSTGANTASVAPAANTSYTVLGMSAAGCTAQAVSNITVVPNPVINIGSNTPVCLGFNLNLTSGAGGVYNWTGPNGFTSAVQNPVVAAVTNAAAGVYNLTVTTAGCSSSGNVSVAIVTPTVNATNTGPYCAGATVQLNGTAALSYTWTGPNGFTSNSQNPTIPNSTPLATGTYSLKVSIGTCTALSTTTVTVNALPVPTIIGNSPVCEASTFTMQGGGGGNYMWNGPSFSSNLQNVSFASAPLSANGVYTLIVTDANNCSQSTTYSATILALPLVSAAGSTACVGGTATLTSAGGGSYSWSGPNGFTSNLQNPTIPVTSPSVAGVYYLTVTAANGCSVAVSANIGAYTLPNVAAWNSGPVCLGAPVTFSSSGGFIYSWTGPNDFVAPIQNPVLGSANSLDFTGTYTVGVIDNKGCHGYATTDLLVRDLPHADLTATKKEGCIPYCSSFGLVGNSNIVSATWNTNGLGNASGMSYSDCFKIDGKFVIKSSYTDVYGCKNSSTIAVNSYPIPSADFSYGPGRPVEEDEVAFSDASLGSSINQWNWFFVSNDGYTSLQQNPTYVFHQPGGYAVTLIVANKWGCKDTITKSIQIFEDFNLYIPNAFTPNSDGLNDIFQPKGHGLVKYTMRIFDRWGEQLYYSKELTNGWDGTMKGKLCPSDDYIYKITVFDLQGKSKLYTGHVTLLR